MPFRMRRPSSAKQADDPVSQTVQALQGLQGTLHNLTPADQAKVQRALPFASPESVSYTHLTLPTILRV